MKIERKNMQEQILNTYKSFFLNSKLTIKN